MSCIANPNLVNQGNERTLPAPVVFGPLPPCPFRNAFAIAGIGVQISGNSREMVEFSPQVQPFTAEPGPADIEVSIDWAPRLEPIHGPVLFDSGCVWSVHQVAGGYTFDFTTARFGYRPYKRLMVDTDYQQATILLNRQILAPEDAGCALEYPLDELLITHHLSLGRGVELHACGLVNGMGETFLFAGHSGAGKSTTARLWSECTGSRVLSDDRIILRSKGAGGRERPPYTFLMHGTPWHGEAAFALPESAPVRRIFLLEHGSENRIERISRSEAVGELLARSFTPLYDSRFVEPVLTFVEEVTESVPCYRFRFVPDVSAVENIIGFHD